MIESVLIANRGEIARRIIRTAKALGIRTIAAHSDVDARLPFVREADEAVAIGPAPARDSYLNGAGILAAARRTDAAAIHPGYGFLSENADFAAAVLAAGLVWIGPPPAAVRTMGLKHAAKALMQKAGVPVTPGYSGDDQSPERLRSAADAIGYPVLIKAVAGGGGKGMRRVDESAAFGEALASCCREAKAAFGDDRVLIEKYVGSSRHIEVQVFGDTHGNIVHLFERDCSLQRRHQKVVEEAPAPGMDEATRAAIGGAAIRAAHAVGYVGAGTVEFIADASAGLRSDRIWFMEMNTRLQVEHPVTEAITGQDLVEWQFRVASGELLPKRQDELRIDGWAMEGRLYAENPATGFLPSTGMLQHLRLPGGIRVDSGVEEGDEITSHYDPMIAKLIVHAPSRRLAAARLAAACGTVEAWPVKTNAGFLARTAVHEDFVAGRIDTGFIDHYQEILATPTEPDAGLLAAAARMLIPNRTHDPWTALPGFRVNAGPAGEIAVAVAGQTCRVALDFSDDTAQDIRSALIDGRRVVFSGGEAWPVDAPALGAAETGSGLADGAIMSPMPGLVTLVEVAEGGHVAMGQRLLVMEAMKMEQGLFAPFDGVVTALKAVPGSHVAEGVLLARVERDPA